MTDVPEPSSNPCLEMAHVLFMDIVAYSTSHMDHQQRLIAELQEAVRGTSEFARAQAEDKLIRLPTGDGMALVFFRDPESPVRCALELSRNLREHPEIKLRMGIHSGPVYRVADINANRNVAGGGINIAQRVMDCGDAGHILLSGAEAEVLGQVSGWSSVLHDLGEIEVKHGLHIHVYNLYTDEVGNDEVPKRMRSLIAASASTTGALNKKKLSWVMIATLLVVTTLAAVGGWLFFSRKVHALKATDTVVLADFTNKTGDAVFDDTLKQALSVSLAQSPFLNILSDTKVRSTLKLMGRSPGDPLPPDVALEVCQRTGSAAVFAGSIASLGSQYVLGLHAMNCRTGEMLAQEQVQAAHKEDVLKALDQASAKLREKVGESLGTIEKYDTPLEQATTPSLDALKAFSQGNKIVDDAAVIPYYKRAVELDPKFATAYLNLGLAYSNLHEAGAANETLAKAFELRERASERERLSIEANYYTYVSGDIDKARTTYKRWAQAYPQDSVPYGNLAIVEADTGNYNQAIKDTQEALRLSPGSSTAYGNLVGQFVSVNRLDEAKSLYKETVARKAENYGLHANMYGLAFLEGDRAEMDRQVAWTAGKAGAEDFLLSLASDTEAYYGRNSKARELSRRAFDSAKHNDQKETAAQWQMEAALREAELGNSTEARQQAKAALALASNHDSQILGALAFARAGDSAKAARMADDLAKRYPEDTLVNNYWLPSIRATIELGRNNADKAIEILQAAVPYELGSPTPAPVVAGMLYPIYVRGQAYVKLRLGKEAAAEFQKILDHRTIVQNFITGALAHLGLAHAYALQGDTAKARAAYNDFFTLWKDADPDIPILKQAKAEYAKLQ